MKYKEFIGIDVSKFHIDVYIYSVRVHAKFKNNETGFKKMMCWIWNHIDCSSTELLLAFEHTGLYSLPLSLFMNTEQYSFVMIPGLQLKKSQGISRGKSDKMDAKAIAEYVYEKREKIEPCQLPCNTLLKLKRLLSYRERLVKERTAFKTRLGEYKLILDEEEDKVLFESHQRFLSLQNEEIKAVEKEMDRFLKENKILQEQFKWINTIKGVGPVTALTIIVLTDGFTKFKVWRKFASYAGIAPFPYESGKMNRGSKISHYANKRIKALFSCCACSAIQFNPEIKLYCERRVQEGKNEMSTLNIIRNKLLARIFAVVERKSAYVDIFNYAA